MNTKKASVLFLVLFWWKSQRDQEIKSVLDDLLIYKSSEMCH